MKASGRLVTRLVQLGFLVALLLAWHLSTATGAINPLILPTVPSVWRQFEKLIASGAYWPHLQVTLMEYLISMSIFIPSGLTIGYLVSRSRYATRTFDPLFSGLYAIPQIILLPVYILYFGLGPGSKIAVGATIGFFPVVLNTIAGFASVDPLYVTAAKSMGASGFKMFWSVMVPAAFPVVLTGLRIGLIISFLAILGTETIVSLSGLGHRIVTLAELLNTSLMFAYILFAVMVAIVLNFVVSTAEAQRPPEILMRTLAQPVHPSAYHETLARLFGSKIGAWLARPGGSRLLIIIAFFLVWEVGVRFFGDPLFLSPPSQVAGGFLELIRDPKVVNAVLMTFWEIFVGFMLSVIIGVSIGLPVGLNLFSRRSLFPIILLLYATPQVVFLPLVILYFGIGAASKIAFGISHGIFPIIVTVVAGVQNLNPTLLTASRSMGASKRQILRWVVFPHMIPSLFTGMRLGMTGVLLGVLLAELYVSSGGIGYYTRLFTDTFAPSKVFALVGGIAVFAVVLNELCRRAESHFQRWRG